MTFVLVGTETADLNAPGPLKFPPVSVTSDRGYYFLLSTPVPMVNLANLYFTVVAVLTSAIGDIELPLEGKWFPKDRLFMFSVGVPNLDEINQTDISIEVEPKRRFTGQNLTSTVPVRLYFEPDDEERNISVPT